MSSHHSRNNRTAGTNTLLMTKVVESPGGSISTILDPCLNLSLITHRIARKLNLKGKKVRVSLTKVGNVTETVTTMEYELKLKDVNKKMCTIVTYGIEEITSNIEKVDISEVSQLFEHIQMKDIERPAGKIDLLLGLDCCQSFPDKIAQVGNLQLMKGPLGYCLRGNHPLIQFTESQSNFMKIIVHLTHVEQATLTDEIGRFFDIESLGTFPVPKCEHCEHTSDETDSVNITIREERELEMIKKGLDYDPVHQQWTVKYPWVKDANRLPNNFAAAFGQLKSLEKRLTNSPYLNVYCEQINDMVKRNVARKLTAGEMKVYNGPIHYIPHKLSSNSTPLRIVFNSSSAFMGHKLNDYWTKGPDVLNSLIGVLLRFREDNISYCLGYIEDVQFNSLRKFGTAHSPFFMERYGYK